MSDYWDYVKKVIIKKINNGYLVNYEKEDEDENNIYFTIETFFRTLDETLKHVEDDSKT